MAIQVGRCPGQGLVQQWPRRGSRDCQGLNMHNFLNICPNEKNEESISMYVKRL